MRTFWTRGDGWVVDGLGTIEEHGAAPAVKHSGRHAGP